MVYGHKHIRRGWDGKYRGFRMNCESVPILPASIVRWVWDDPRAIPYLLIWTNSRDGQPKEAVRIVRSASEKNGFREMDSVEVRRTTGTKVTVYLEWRRPPHGGRVLLLRCWQCQKPSRALYGYKVGNDGRYYKAVPSDWECRRCAGLSYSSEGGYLRPAFGRMSQFGVLLRASWGNLPRPELWYPYVFTDPDEGVRWLKQIT